MKLTTSQVAEKLHITKSAVLAMTKAGKLTDIAVNGNGKRHHRMYNSKQVNAFAKEYHPRKRRITVQLENPKAPQLFQSKFESITTRLTSIESKLNQLVQMWS